MTGMKFLDIVAKTPDGCAIRHIPSGTMYAVKNGKVVGEINIDYLHPSLDQWDFVEIANFSPNLLTDYGQLIPFPNTINTIVRFYDAVIRNSAAALNMYGEVSKDMTAEEINFFYMQEGEILTSRSIAFAGIVIRYFESIDDTFAQCFKGCERSVIDDINAKMAEVLQTVNTIFGSTVDSWAEDFSNRINNLTNYLENISVPHESTFTLKDIITKHLEYLEELKNNVERADILFNRIYNTYSKSGVPIQYLLSSISNAESCERVTIECGDYKSRFIVNGEYIIPCEPSYDEISASMLLSNSWRIVSKEELEEEMQNISREEYDV